MKHAILNLKAALMGAALVLASQALALDPAIDPALAVVRIKSHGASGTIVATTEGKSYILSCAHMFKDENDKIDPKLISKKIVIDGPAQPQAPQKLASVRVIAADADMDLSLLEIENGPFNYVRVAPAGFRPGQNISSAGYDDMKWPITHMRETIVGHEEGWTFTKDKPWHGRSGGGLFDLDAKCLIGVVNGYEIRPGGRGIYVSHGMVLRFLTTYLGKTQQPQQQARPPVFQSFPGRPLCPT